MTERGDPGRKARALRAAPGFVWALAGAGTCLSVAGLEPNLVEEGFVLHFAQRLARGEHLYRDLVFFTGPLPFELLGALFRAFGEEIAYRGYLLNRGGDALGGSSAAFWIAAVATAVLFLLVGFAFTTQMFVAHALDMLIAIGAVLVARAAAVFGLLSWSRSENGRSAALAERGAIVWCGLRGGVTLALVLSLPLELEGWFALQSMAYGVVLFTLLVQAPTVPWVIARLPRHDKLKSASSGS